MDVSNLCRSCMKEMASWETDIFDQRAMEMFSFSTNIEINEDDKLPKQFCHDCTIQIESMYTYIKRAQDINVILKNIVSRADTVIIVEPDKQMITVKCESNLISQNNNEIKMDDDDGNSFFDNISYKLDITDNSIQAEIDPIKKMPLQTSKKTKLKKAHAILQNNDMKMDDYGNSFINNISYKFEITDNLIQPEIDPVQDMPLETSKKTKLKKAHATDQSKKEEENTEGRSVYCNICKQAFVNKSWLVKHMRKHQYDTTLKQTVIKQASSDNAQSQSEQQSGEEKKLRECQLCRKTFVSKLWFTRHMEKEHSDFKIYSCSHCLKTFATYNQLRYHRQHHSEERRFACSECSKRFRTRKLLAAHALAHADARPYACEHCDMRFKIKSILVGHMKVHENNKHFLCSVCGWGFNLPTNLEEHMRVHTGEKPHACAKCTFRTAFLSNLRRHERRHRDERTHACPSCAKRFYEPGSLKRHMRTHTGERPYACEACARTFTDSWKRKAHMMRAHHVALADIPRVPVRRARAVPAPPPPEPTAKMAPINPTQILFTKGATGRLKFIVLSKMDLAYRQMPNEALLLLEHSRVSAELPNAPALLEVAPLQGDGLAALRTCLVETQPSPL